MQLLIIQTQNIKRGITKKKNNPKILSCFAYKVDLDYGNFINVGYCFARDKKRKTAGMKQGLFTPPVCKPDKVPGGSGTFTVIYQELSLTPGT